MLIFNLLLNDKNFYKDKMIAVIWKTYVICDGGVQYYSKCLFIKIMLHSAIECFLTQMLGLFVVVEKTLGGGGGGGGGGNVDDHNFLSCPVL